jgi:ornithine--oxo-acid transaminase
MHSYGGNPLACAVACAALDVLVDEDLCARALALGKTFRAGLETLRNAAGGGWITEVRGVGLFTAIVIDEHRSKKGRGAWELCCLMASKGALAKPTHVNMCVALALECSTVSPRARPAFD